MNAAEITEGARVRFTRSLERFPHFTVPEGAVGEVVEEASHEIVCVRMDEPLPGAEPWDNEVLFTTDDAEGGDARGEAALYLEGVDDGIVQRTALDPFEALDAIVTVIRRHDGEAVLDLEAIVKIVRAVPAFRGRVEVGAEAKILNALEPGTRVRVTSVPPWGEGLVREIRWEPGLKPLEVWSVGSDRIGYFHADQVEIVDLPAEMRLTDLEAEPGCAICGTEDTGRFSRSGRYCEDCLDWAYAEAERISAEARS